ncbi:Ecdysteroid UDP-glucosyltransferase, partial [Papilio machaon]
DLKSIMDNAKHGVIYFSLGSNLNSQDVLDTYNEILMDVFSHLRQVVLWKHELKFTHLPSNVHILNWAPQQSILSHPNCILFMTQGGALSSIEALHFGVAILGIPIIADQFTNIKRAVDQGYAKQVDLPYSTGEDIKDTVEEMIRNPRYAKIKVLELLMQ